MTDIQLMALYQDFQSLQTQNERILFFNDPDNIARMSKFDINIENLKKHHIEVWDKAFPHSTWDSLK